MQPDRDRPAPDLRQITGAIEALSVGFALFDAEDRLVLCNTALGSLHPGMEGLLQPGLSWPLFMTEAERHGTGDGLAALDRHLSAGTGRSIFVEIERTGGRWVRAGLHPTAEDGFVLTESDVTDVKASAQAQQEAESLLGRVFEASPVNLMIYDLDAEKFLYWTPSWAALFGHPATVQDMWADVADRADYLAELLARDRIDDFETRLRARDGSIFPARVSAQLIDYDGTMISVSSTQDMTQLYAQRDELARRREATYQTEKLTALGELLAGVAHELNNPLSVVVGQALMLREEVDDPDAARRIEKVSTAAERCAKIVKTFLAMARQRPMQLLRADLNGIIETAVDVAAYGLRSTGGIVDVALGADLPPVLADEDQIAQVFVNLLVNAEQALEGQAGERRVTVRSWSENGRVCASVSDNGPGVPEAARARVFEPFFTTKGLGKGTGVGLALCHRIVTTHDGTLELDTALEGGALFTMSLPAAEAGQAALETPESAAPTPGLTALVVEDDAEIAETIGDILRRIGVAVTLAPSGERALGLIENGASFDMILSDLKMPGMGGRAFYETLRKNRPAIAKRVAFITGDAMSTDAEAIRKSSNRPLLEKPVAPGDLHALVQRLANEAG